MAGRLTISTLTDDTGVLATQNGMSGICKAWVNFNGTGTVAIRGSFNVSSITDNGTGSYTLNFTTAMPDANYSVVALAQDSSTKMLVSGNPDNVAPTTTAYRLVTSGSGGGSAQLDSTYVFAAVFR